MGSVSPLARKAEPTSHRVLIVVATFCLGAVLAFGLQEIRFDYIQGKVAKFGDTSTAAVSAADAARQKALSDLAAANTRLEAAAASLAAANKKKDDLCEKVKSVRRDMEKMKTEASWTGYKPQLVNSCE